jgi:tRNA dimethylallyltransferase
MRSSLPPLLVLLGPTAVGKTKYSIRLAQALDGQIISADSRLLYRGMDIGTAKPSASEQARVKHHLIDVADPDESWSLARYQRAALAAVAAVTDEGQIPLLVGGTGQYLAAVVEGWRPPPGPDHALRGELFAFADQHGSESLHRRLAEIDPRRAETLDHRNVRRVVRALEIYHLTGRPPSEQQWREPPPYRILRLGLERPREELYARIDTRLEAMLEQGLVDEVRGLLEAGIEPHAPALSAIGYRQIVEYLQGEHDLDSAMAEIRRASRRFVRHQTNWFQRGSPPVRWFRVEAGLEKELVSFVQGWLRGDVDPE